jgi:hypothetical protein
MLGLDEQILERRSLARNEALFRQGEKVTAIYFVEAGTPAVRTADVRRPHPGPRHDAALNKGWMSRPNISRSREPAVTR